MFPMFPPSLLQWAKQQGWSKNRAYRAFQAASQVDEATGVVRAELVDAQGQTVYAERVGDGVIRVYYDGKPNPLGSVSADDLVARLLDATNIDALAAKLLDALDVDALAAKLKAAGHVVLTPGQAQVLGLANSPHTIPTQIQEEAR
jgi:hypothetical protein